MPMTVNQEYAVNQWPAPLLSGGGVVSINWFPLCWEWIGSSIVMGDRTYTNNIEDNNWIDGGFLVSHLLKRWWFSIEFHISWSDAIDLQNKVDSFKGATGQKNIILSINTGNDIRLMKVNSISTNMDRLSFGSLIQSGTISFEAVSPPRAYSQNIDIKSYNNITTDFIGEVNNFSNAPTYPVYIFQFRDVSDLTQLIRKINWYPITINYNFENNDVLVISADMYNIIQKAGVFVNNEKIDFLWQLTTPLNPEEYSIQNNQIQLITNDDAVYDCDISILSHKMRE